MRLKQKLGGGQVERNKIAFSRTAMQINLSIETHSGTHKFY
jgi:hypothetical protein